MSEKAENLSEIEKSPPDFNLEKVFVTRYIRQIGMFVCGFVAMYHLKFVV